MKKSKLRKIIINNSTYFWRIIDIDNHLWLDIFKDKKIIYTSSKGYLSNKSVTPKFIARFIKLYLIK